MPTYTQAGRALSIVTPLGPDALLLERVSGSEAISELFRFQLELLAEKAVDFDKLLGQEASIALQLPNGVTRSVHGIISRLTQGRTVTGPKGTTTFIRYRAELVPELWLLTRRKRSRIFQDLSVPDVVKAVFRDWQIDASFKLSEQYPKRNYCTQFQETDYAFICRLMEEEGICFYFASDSEAVTVTDSAAGYANLPAFQTVIYDETEGGFRAEPRIRDWEKTQELRICKHTVRDYHFEKPDSSLEAQERVAGTVAVGKVNHGLNHQRVVNGVEMLENYEGCGDFAHHFDGVDAAGSKQPKEIENLFEENRRLARIRQEQETVAGLRIDGCGDCAHFRPGYKFNLERHFDAGDSYVITRVEHQASIEGAYTTAPDVKATYESRFECLPSVVTYRPPAQTPRPRLGGAQTATVVGPAAEEIWCDHHGRVKVHFHWDRDGKRDGGDSCWVRVAQTWAGQGWGMLTLPRIGHEVIVTFIDENVDKPLITGSLYNAKQRPPFNLPAEKTHTGIKSRSNQGKAQEFHGLAFSDKSGGEILHMRSQQDMFIDAKRNHMVVAPNNHATHVGGYQLNIVGGLSVPGSGSGGGYESDSASGGYKDTDPIFGVIPSFGHVSLGMRTDVVYGLDSHLCGGSVTEVNLPSKTHVVIDPMDMIGMQGGNWSYFGKLPGGDVKYVYGNFTYMNYGLRREYTRGYRLDMVGPMSTTMYDTARIALAVIHAVCTGGSVILPVAVATTNSEAAKYTSMSVSILSTLSGVLLKYFENCAAREQAAELATLMSKDLAQQGLVAGSASVPALAKKIAKQGVGFLDYSTSATAQLTGVHSHLVNGTYALQGDNVIVGAKKGISLIARDDGSIFLDSVKQDVTIASGSCTVMVSGSDKKITLDCGTNGSIFLQSKLGPLTTCVGLKQGSVVLRTSPTQYLLMDSTGITIASGPSKITVANDGIEMVGTSNVMKSIGNTIWNAIKHKLNI